MNDPTFVESARVLAGSSLQILGKSDDEKLDLVFERVLARPAKPIERESLVRFLAQQRIEAHDHPEDVAKLLKVGLAPNPTDVDLIELAAWTEVCRVLLNLHESITRY